MFRVLREEVPPSSLKKKAKKKKREKQNDAIFKRESNPCVRLTDEINIASDLRVIRSSKGR